MNIFIYDLDIKINASYYPDSHLIKIPLEIAQMLSTVYRKIKNYTGEAVYKPTHENHPCTLWISESYANFKYAIDLFYALHDEWNKRYKHDKIHKCFGIVSYIENNLTINDFNKLELTKFAQAMPDNYIWLSGKIIIYLNGYK